MIQARKRLFVFNHQLLTFFYPPQPSWSLNSSFQNYLCCFSIIFSSFNLFFRDNSSYLLILMFKNSFANFIKTSVRCQLCPDFELFSIKVDSLLHQKIIKNINEIKSDFKYFLCFSFFPSRIWTEKVLKANSFFTISIEFDEKWKLLVLKDISKMNFEAEKGELSTNGAVANDANPIQLWLAMTFEWQPATGMWGRVVLFACQQRISGKLCSTTLHQRFCFFNSGSQVKVGSKASSRFQLVFL